MIRALLASPLGFLVGLSLGVLGSGGSILAVPALVHAAGQSPHEATATSLLLVGVATMSGLPAHYRAGRVNVATGVAFGVAGIGGSLAGSALSRRLDPDVLLLAFAGLIAIAAWRMLTACPTCTRTGEATALERAGEATAIEDAGEAAALQSTGLSRAPSLNAGRIVLLIAAGTGVGFLTGLFGVGGGFVIVPVLTLLLGFAMPQAIGTSLLVVAINSAVALAARIASVHIQWTVAAAFTVTAVAGVLAGGRIADRIDAGRTLRVFAAGLVLLALYTAGTAVAGLG